MSDSAWTSEELTIARASKARAWTNAQIGQLLGRTAAGVDRALWRCIGLTGVAALIAVNQGLPRAKASERVTRFIARTLGV